MRKKHGNEGGRPEFRPTNEQRQTVRLCKADGWSDERIAVILGIARNTLTKHFAHELEHGADEERKFAVGLLRKAAERNNIAAIKAYIQLIGTGGAIEGFLGDPEPKPRIRPRGKKQIAHEEALRAHEASDWGNDLKPLPELGEARH